jgi:hypothetical protein
LLSVARQALGVRLNSHTTIPGSDLVRHTFLCCSISCQVTTGVSTTFHESLAVSLTTVSSKQSPRKWDNPEFTCRFGKATPFPPSTPCDNALPKYNSIAHGMRWLFINSITHGHRKTVNS